MIVYHGSDKEITPPMILEPNHAYQSGGRVGVICGRAVHVPIIADESSAFRLLYVALATVDVDGAERTGGA